MNIQSLDQERKGRKSCGQCISCYRQDDCGMCRACREMKKFGGPGRTKDKCHQRRCLKFKVLFCVLQ